MSTARQAADDSFSLVPSAREAFFTWLTGFNSRKYQPEVMLSCIDQASEFAIRKKISQVSIWRITKRELFRQVRDKILEDKAFKVTYWSMYDEFLKAGLLYMQFLIEKSNTKKYVPEHQAAKMVTSNESLHLKAPHEIQSSPTTSAVHAIRDAVPEKGNVPKAVDDPFPLISSTRKVFSVWLNGFNSKEYQPEVILSCIDQASNYAIRKKISRVSIWQITKRELFRQVRDRLAEDNVFKVVYRQRYEVFLKAGLLYMQFLIANLHEVKYVPEPKYQDAKISPSTESLHQRALHEVQSSANVSAANAIRDPLPEKSNEPNIFHILEGLGLKYIDKRSTGGALCVIGGIELTNVMLKLQEAGHHFSLKLGRGGSGGLEEAWWYKPLVSEPKPIFIPDVPKSVPTPPSVPVSTPEDGMILRITDILSSHFSNGFRLRSPIELIRFRSFAQKDYGMDIPLSNEELEEMINTCGTDHQGKVYLITDQTKNQIKVLADEYFAQGAHVIFFEEFYTQHDEWLNESGIISVAMLEDILHKLYPKKSFTFSYFGSVGYAIPVVLESELLRVWGDNVLLSCEQLKHRMKYVPYERIRAALRQNSHFLNSGTETYTLFSLVDITNEEKIAIQEVAYRICNQHGYVSIDTLPLVEIEERNHQLSMSAIFEAVFNICLSKQFTKRGKIITRLGDTLDALTIMKEYCRSQDVCQLDDMRAYAKEMIGDLYPQLLLEAGYSVMVRTELETFVADRLVRFDISAVDEAIDLVMQGDYLPVKSFTSFAAFPDCGQTWNLYMLESYCSRFSRKFRYESPSLNSRNAGVVARRSCPMGYQQIMIDAVTKANIDLVEKTVSDFLYDNGYTGRNTKNVNRAIIDTIQDERRS